MRIGLDFDGVIANCGKLKREGARRLFGVDIPEEKFKKEIVLGEGLLTADQYQALQKEIYDRPDIGLLAEPVVGMQEHVQALQDTGYQFFIITSRETSALEVAKQWLDLHKISLPMVGIGPKETKESACRTLRLTVFVDDDLDKLEHLAGCVPHLFLFSWGYNKHIEEKPLAVRVYSWQDLHEKMKTLSN